MNLFTPFRKSFRRRTKATAAAPTIEPLEARIAPAMLVSPTTVTFQDKNGDAVTVTISKSLFTATNVASVFTFDTGAFGNNDTPQQLEALNITKLGKAATGIDISIVAVPVGSSPVGVNVGFINAGAIDLGNVTVGGDLGRIAAGNFNLSTPGLHSLTVRSLGEQGLLTQAAGGNLNSLISGGVGSITVDGDIDGASIGIGGGVHGLLGSLLVTGSINGGAADFSGSVRTQGGITSVTVDGSIVGGGGASSGIIGTAGALGTVLVEGSVTGGGGTFSGAILSTKSMGSVTIDGSITGGGGMDSGQVGTASTLGTVTVEGSVLGGGGSLSGVVLATGNISAVIIDGSLTGGIGAGGGQIGSGASIGPVTIVGSMLAGAEIHATQNIGAVSVNSGGPSFTGAGLHPLEVFNAGPGPGILDSFIVADKGSIGSITAGGNGSGSDYPINDAINGSIISAGGNIGSIQAEALYGVASTITNSGFDAGGSIGGVDVVGAVSGSVFIAGIDLGTAFNVTGAGGFGNGDFGFGASKPFVAAHIGTISADFIEQSTFLAGVHGAGADRTFGTNDDAVSTGSSVGAITSPGGLNTDFVESGSIGATNSGEIVNTNYIATDTAVSAGGIGPITVTTSTPVLVANYGGSGGAGLTVSGAGTVLLNGAGGYGGGAILEAGTATTINGGVLTVASGGPGVLIPSTFGSGDTLTLAPGTVISVPSTYSGTLTPVDGTVLSLSGSGSLVYTGSGSLNLSGGTVTIDPVTGTLSAAAVHTNEVSSPPISSDDSHGIYNSTFVSNSGIGAVNVTLNGVREPGENAGISSSTFQAGHAIGTITVVNNASGTGGSNYGIVNTTFNGGLNGYGGMGDISVTLTDAGPDGNSAAIANSFFDASVCSCMSANMGSISAENADTDPTAVGILDSVFRVHGNIGPISATMDSGSPTAAAIQGSMFSAYGSIGAINVYGAVVADTNGPSRFLAGYDIGADMTFGNEDLSANSLFLQAAQSVGDVTVTGYFMGSDIIASINPGAGYVFGSSANTNIGAGGSIGLVNIGTNVSLESSPFTFDHATSHAIEAANFALAESEVPTVTAFGYTSDIPVVLYVDGGAGDVRITNLTQADT